MDGEDDCPLEAMSESSAMVLFCLQAWVIEKHFDVSQTLVPMGKTYIFS